MTNKKYYLGLDLGISSVGWAVMTEEDNKDFYIDDFGVRLFDCSESPKDGKTNAEARREFRSARRLIRRRKQRISDLKGFLEKHNIIKILQINSFFKDYKVTNNIKYDDKKYFNPYVIRAKGLSEKLTPQELAAALINIANHRGYNDKFSFTKDEKDKKSKLDGSISEASKVVKQYFTIAQAIISDKNFKNQLNDNTLGLIHNKIKKNKAKVDENDKNIKTETSNYRYLFAREDYKKELQLILNNQAKFYPQLTKENISVIINDIILRQRDFEDGPGPKDLAQRDKWKANMKPHRLFQSFLATEGKCTFYGKESRAYRCSLTFEIFQMISALSTFSVKFLDENQTINVVNAIFSEIKKGNILDKNGMKDLIVQTTGIDKKAFKSEVWTNKQLKFNFAYLKLLNLLVPEHFKTINFQNLSNHIFNQIGELLHKNITPKKRQDALTKFFKNNNINLSEKQIESFLSFKNTSTANCSFKYMQEAINAFSEGIAYGKFQADFNKAHDSQMFNFEIAGKKLFQPIKDQDMSRNAVVFRAVNQARKIIKALYQKYGFFAVINVEVARELAKSFNERNEIKKDNDLNYERKVYIEEVLKVNDIKVNDINVKKYRLWEQQNKKCIYCQDHHEIKIEQIDNSGALQVDHIIPQSVISDDSLNNLVLTCNKSNQEKGKQTPLQWLKNNKEHRNSYLNFCNKEIRKNLSDKKLDYLMTEDINDEKLQEFASRNLNDTRYITRYVTNWLKQELTNWQKTTGEVVPTTVQSINGAVTSRFRRTWLRNSAWGLDEKVRDITPFHHAVDAIILTQFTSTSYVAFASDIANIMQLKWKKSKDLKYSEEDFQNDCAWILKKWSNKDSKLNVPDAVQRLKKVIISEKREAMSPLVKNLKDIIEKRIPVILQICEIEKPITLKNQKNQEMEIPNKVVKRPVKEPQYVQVLNQEEYKEKMQQSNLKGDIHYPFISYKVDYKLSGAVTSSQLPVSNKKDKKGKKQPNRLYENGKLKESYVKDKNDMYWEVNTYYGVVINFDDKCQWIRRIDAKKDYLKDITKNNVILVPRNIVEYYDKNKKKKVIKLFRGKDGNSIYANLIGTQYISDKKSSPEVFGVQNYRDSISNWKKDFNILKPSLLGKVVTD